MPPLYIRWVGNWCRQVEINAQLSVVAICKGRLNTSYASMVCQVDGELVQAGGNKCATFCCSNL